MKHSKSGLFLMELIISILFFALASTTCIQLFVKSHLMEQETVDKNHAVIQAQNLAECFLDADGNVDALKLYMKEGVLDSGAENIFALYFDSNWIICDQEQASYLASLVSHGLDKAIGLITADITVQKIEDSHLIYSLYLEHHIQERRGA